MSSDNSLFQNLAANLPWIVPTLLIGLLGVALAVTFYRRCPKAAILTMLAVVLLVVESTVSAGLRAYLITVLPPENLSKWFILTSVIATFFHSTSICLLIIAVFVDRGRPAEGGTLVEGLAAAGPEEFKGPSSSKG